MNNIKMDELVNFCKQYGFIFQGSEIYGGLSNSWDYGPLGREIKENIKRAWWKKFIQEEKNSYGLDAAIIMNPEVWVASGHVSSFADPLIDCKACKSRYRADKLIEDFTEGKETGDGWSNEKLEKFISDNKVPCPKCGKSDFTEIRKFNLLSAINFSNFSLLHPSPVSLPLVKSSTNLSALCLALHDLQSINGSAKEAT